MLKPQRALFVSWAAALGGVESSVHARMLGLRALGVESEKLFFQSGDGLESFADFPVYVTERRDQFASIVRDRGYDLISLINTAHHLKTLLEMGFRGKVIYEVRGLSSAAAKYLPQLSAREIHAIIVPSSFVAGLVHQGISDRAIPVHVVYNATDTKLFRPLDRPDLSLAPQLFTKPVVLWVGRLDTNKNWREMLAIAKLLIQRGQDLSFAFVVDTSMSSDLDQFHRSVEQFGLRDRVRLHSSVPRPAMPHFYAIAALSGGCTISTSRSEGFQNSLLEAMACGCPVISSAIPGNTELITDGNNGRLYPIGNLTAAAQAIEEIVHRLQEREQMVRRGLARIMRDHTPIRHAESFLRAVYQAQIGGS